MFSQQRYMPSFGKPAPELTPAEARVVPLCARAIFKVSRGETRHDKQHCPQRMQLEKLAGRVVKCPVIALQGSCFSVRLT